jgi:hypothetical protein
MLLHAPLLKNPNGKHWTTKNFVLVQAMGLLNSARALNVSNLISNRFKPFRISCKSKKITVGQLFVVSNRYILPQFAKPRRATLI